MSDLLRHLPVRYEREWAEGAIGDLPMDGVGSARGTVVACRHIPPAGRKSRGRFEATLQDHSDRLSLVWFNQPYLRKALRPGMVLRVQGKVAVYNGYAQMVNPTWEELKQDAGGAAGGAEAVPAKDERLRPIYPATEDLSSTVLERIIAEILPRVLPQVTDPLPAAQLQALAMPALAEALRMAHQPKDADEPAQARRRLAYNELLLLQLGICLKRHFNATMLRAPALRWSAAIDQHIRARMPFTLTDAQDHAVREIARDLQQERPMNRLLQGEVGSGKTVVALYALLTAAADRKQGAIMAPTELLAEQHHLSIRAMLAGSNVRLALLTGGQSTARSPQRRELLRRIEQGEVDIVIGTQALLTDAVQFADLAVVVVDEQHRFGVLQRASFRTPPRPRKQEASESSRPHPRPRKDEASESPRPRPDEATDRPSEAKAGEDDRQRSPHYLVMTATPIPRTLSMTVFGDLDVSTIRGLPPGRSPVATRVVRQSKRDEVYDYVAGRVAGGEQAYVVVPLIDGDDDEQKASPQQLRSVTQQARTLRERYPELRIEAIHGRMKTEDREKVMQKFRDGTIDVLVATTVIEVGVDVPNATLMVIEHAERFGLAQLHQLRGRIGRGQSPRKNLCVLIADPTTEEAQQRLDAVAQTSDGFKIAEADLNIRGMGEFFGTRQHGLPPLRVARIPDDMALLQQARRDAEALVKADPALADPAHHLLRKVLVQQYGEALGLVDVG